MAPNDTLISLEEYFQKLYTIATNKSKFFAIKGHIIGKQELEALDFDLTIKHEIKHLFVNKPTFEKYMRLIKFTENW